MALSNLGASPARHVVRALIGAAITGALCAVAWSFVAASAANPSAWLAVASGLLIGLAVRYGGRAIGDWFGLIAVGATLATTLAGSALGVLALIAQEQALSYLQVWQVADFNMVYLNLVDRISALEAGCLGVAVLMAYGIASLRFRSNAVEHALPHVQV